MTGHASKDSCSRVGLVVGRPRVAAETALGCFPSAEDDNNTLSFSEKMAISDKLWAGKMPLLVGLGMLAE